MSMMKCPLCEGKGELIVSQCLETELGRAALAQAMIEILHKIKQACDEQPELAEDPGYEIRFNDKAPCPLCEGIGKIDTDERRVKNVFHVANYKPED